MSDAPAPVPPPAQAHACAWHTGVSPVVSCAACGAPLCDQCASQIIEPGAPAWAAACPTCAPNFQVASSVPFDDPELGNSAAWLSTLSRSLLKPARFFNCFRDAPLGPAMLYAYGTGLFGAAFTSMLLWGNVRAIAQMRADDPSAPMSPFGPMPNEAVMREMEPVMNATMAILPMALWLLTPLSLALLAGALHLPATMLGGRASFRTTFRAAAFLSPLWVLFAPGGGCCAPVWYAWAAVVMFHCFRRPHGLTVGRSIGALAIAAVLLCMIGCGLIMVTACSGFIAVGPEAFK